MKCCLTNANFRQTALKNAAFVREEHEWLQRQLEVVGQEKEQVEDENATQLGEHEGNVSRAADHHTSHLRLVVAVAAVASALDPSDST